MVYVIGEALIDLVMEPAAADNHGPPRATWPIPAAARTTSPSGWPGSGSRPVLLARLSGDAFGRQLRAHAEANGVDLSCAVHAAEQSTLAVVSLDAERNAEYDFYRTGTADWQWSEAELDRIPADGVLAAHRLAGVLDRARRRT